jgi:hypothetical protein
MDHGFTGWRKSSLSAANGNCVEVAAEWRKSSYSDGNGNCVEVASGNWRKSTKSGSSQTCVEVSSAELVVGVRDTTLNGRGPMLEFSAASWSAFLADTKVGRNHV